MIKSNPPPSNELTTKLICSQNIHGHGIGIFPKPNQQWSYQSCSYYLGQITLSLPHTGHSGRTSRETKQLEDPVMVLPNFSLNCTQSKKLPCNLTFFHQGLDMHYSLTTSPDSLSISQAFSQIHFCIFNPVCLGICFSCDIMSHLRKNMIMGGIRNGLMHCPMGKKDLYLVD